MRSPHVLTVVLAVLMAAQAGLGLLRPAEYRDPDWIRAGWFANDLFTLVVAVPLLLFAAALAARGSFPGTLLRLGLLGYAVYNGAFYLFGAALNRFFPLYVATLVVAAIALIRLLSAGDVQARAARLAATPTTRLVGAGYVAIGLGLAAAWLALWGAHVFAGRPTPVEREAFKLVAALDLSLMAPALVVGGAWLLRGRPWGCVIAAIVGIQASLYLLVLTAGSWVSVHRGLTPAPGEIPVWLPLALVTGAGAAILLAHARAASAAR